MHLSDQNKRKQLAELELIVKKKLGRTIRDFRIVRTEEGVALEGWARSFYVKQLAQHLVQMTFPLIVNRMEVPGRELAAEGQLGTSET
ncbi:MAG: hypothetical protein AB7K24_09175 [Gemmataceae bacterium]